MMEIWVEDSTAGYYFMKRLNKYMLGGVYKVVSHCGNGNDAPTSRVPTGGLLYHLERFKDDRLVMIMADKMMDRKETSSSYIYLSNEIYRHKNVVMIDQLCFEINMLSYQNLNVITGKNNRMYDKIAYDLVNASYNNLEFARYSDELKSFSLNLGPNYKYRESMAKVLLAHMTDTSICIGRETITPSLITRDIVGQCWTKDCCTLSDNRYRKCKLSAPLTITDKLTDVINYSLFNEIVNQIHEVTLEYINRDYRCNSTKEEYYRDKCKSKFKNMDEMRKAKVKCIETLRSWNYERLYRI